MEARNQIKTADKHERCSSALNKGDSEPKSNRAFSRITDDKSITGVPGHTFVKRFVPSAKREISLMYISEPSGSAKRNIRPFSLAAVSCVE